MRSFRNAIAALAVVLLAIGVSMVAGPDVRLAAGARPIRIMALGDSITLGAGSSTGAGYRGELERRLARYHVDFVGSQHSGALPDPDHEGHPGWRIDQLAAAVDGWIAAYQPDVVLLHIGTNDLNQDYQTATAPQRLGALLDQLRADRPATMILVAQLVPATAAAVQARIAAFNAALPAIAAARGSHVKLVDLSGLSTSDMHDTLHPNDSGYAVMAARWSEALEPLLAATS